MNEENNAQVALYESFCTPATTHLEIEPFTVMGVVAGLIPYPHHNQSPRNTYQCAMGKQAMGSIAFNQHERLDTLQYLLQYPQRPLLTTKTIELVGYDRLGAGQNAVVAVMSYSGYDIEDAIVMNRSSLDRGFGRCIVLRKYAASLKKYANRAQDRICRPDAGGAGGGRKPGGPQAAGRYSVLESDGLAGAGCALSQGECLINKQVPLNTRDTLSTGSSLPDSAYRPAPVFWKGYPGERCAVDRVVLTSNDDSACVVKVAVRHTRRPELGDKFSSRHGQKGVVGKIVAGVDMPFSERGIIPDLIMNPHGFPSRMTVGKMIELLGSKAAVATGEPAARHADEGGGPVFGDEEGGPPPRTDPPPCAWKAVKRGRVGRVSNPLPLSSSAQASSITAPPLASERAWRTRWTTLAPSSWPRGSPTRARTCSSPASRARRSRPTSSWAPSTTRSSNTWCWTRCTPAPAGLGSC